MTSPAEIDEQYMRRAIRLGMNARGRAEPNPTVGCVIVKGGRVIGEGFTGAYGGPHAEANALASCVESPAGATAYVSLEPCCHTNKKTPPCAPRLVEAGVGRVVIGALDPNPEVNGRGVAMLRAAKVVVDGPVLEGEARQAIAPFIKRTSPQMPRQFPYVTIKFAVTADGKVAGPMGRRMQISNEHSMRAVHGLRARSDAVLVGIGTVLADDPLLTARGVEAARPLIRAVLDTNFRLPPDSKLVQSARDGRVLVFGSLAAYHGDARARVAALEAAGVIVYDLDPRSQEQPSPSPMSLTEMLFTLHHEGVTHLMVEPGPTLAESFFRDGLVDRVWVFRSPASVHDDSAPAAPRVPGDYVEAGRLQLGGDALTEYLNPRSPVFFANVPSADFVLVRESVQA